jgi:hypothetical protein
MRLRPVLMTLYCRRVMRLVVRSSLNTPANLSLTDLRGVGGWGVGVGWGKKTSVFGLNFVAGGGGQAATRGFGCSLPQQTEAGEMQGGTGGWQQLNAAAISVH